MRWSRHDCEWDGHNFMTMAMTIRMMAINDGDGDGDGDGHDHIMKTPMPYGNSHRFVVSSTQQHSSTVELVQTSTFAIHSTPLAHQRHHLLSSSNTTNTRKRYARFCCQNVEKGKGTVLLEESSYLQTLSASSLLAWDKNRIRDAEWQHNMSAIMQIHQ